MSNSNVHKLTMAGILVSLGIVFGDIGTSPLYVMKSIAGARIISPELILGGISCVFWTLFLQTTFKYVFITLKADNKGEGGVFSLFQLVRKTKKSLIWIAMIGGAMSLAEGIITPPISVSSAVEGISERFPQLPTVSITIGIIILIFLFQPFGTSVVGKAFGPIMVVWFTMLFVLGGVQIWFDPSVLAAINPSYAINLLIEYPGGFWLLGAVFLCTTGAEALYSDLGHCGRRNIRVSWIFVKLALVVNYFGQGAWMLTKVGHSIEKENPFYEIMPDWFRITGVV